MIFNNKKVIVIGDKDGASAPAIEACIKNTEAQVVLSVTACYNCSLGGALDEDLEHQIEDKISRYGSEKLVVILGGSEAEACGITAEAIYSLAVGEKGIRVYHALEKLLIEEYDTEVYREKIGVLEYVLELDSLSKEMEEIRSKFV